MKMCKTMMAALVVAALVTGALVAEEKEPQDSDGAMITAKGFYGKLDVGYANWTVVPSYGNAEIIPCFELVPAFGIMAVGANQMAIDVEFFIDLNFGAKSVSGIDYSTTIVAPGVRILSEKPLSEIFTSSESEVLKKIVPFAGIDVTLPIVHWEIEYEYSVGGGKTETLSADDTEVRFNAGVQAGCRYDITEKLGAQAAFGLRFLGGISWMISAGATYRF